MDDRERFFGRRLRELREYRKLSQRAVARRAGLTGSAICKLEAGESRPDWDTAEALARALGVCVSWFSAGAGQFREPAEREVKA